MQSKSPPTSSADQENQAELTLIHDEPNQSTDSFQYDIVSIMKSNEPSPLYNALMYLQCEFVAERNRVNPGNITWQQFDILTVLRTGAFMPSQIGKRLGMSRSKVSKNLSTLRDLGYIRQTPDAHDRRELETSLTQDGQDMLDIIDQQHKTLEEDARQVWSKTEQEEFTALANRLIAKLRQERVAR